MAADPSEPGRRRRRWRRRVIVGSLGALVAVGLLVLLLATGGDHHRREVVEVPYGETMTSTEYAAIDDGESEAEVLGRLDKTGRPESRTKGYVLILFPQPEEDEVCSYWEFEDELQIFAQLCFDRDSGDLLSKREADVHQGVTEKEGQITA